MFFRIGQFFIDPAYPYPFDVELNKSSRPKLENILDYTDIKRTDVLRLRYLPIDVAEDINKLKSKYNIIVINHRNSIVRIDTNWSIRNLGRSSRKSIIRDCVRLEKKGDIAFKEILSLEEKKEGFREMILWKTKWLNSKHKVAFGFRDRFLKDYICEKFKGVDFPIYRLFSLQVGGQVIAYEVCVQNNQRLMSLIASYDRKFESMGPGRVLTAKILENSEGLGFSIYDLLPPETPFKRSFANDHEDVIELIIPQSILGRIATWIAQCLRII